MDPGGALIVVVLLCHLLEWCLDEPDPPLARLLDIFTTVTSSSAISVSVSEDKQSNCKSGALRGPVAPLLCSC